MKLALSAAALGAALVVGATAQSPAPPNPAPARKVPTQYKLAPQNGSNEAGTATLLDGAGGLIVRLRLTNACGDQPAHIHKGTCEKLDPKPAYGLKPAHEGFSETTVPSITTADLAKGAYAINVHKSTTDIATYVSCGNLAKAK